MLHPHFTDENKLGVNNLSKLTEQVIIGVTVSIKWLLSGKHYSESFIHINLFKSSHYFVK